MTTSKYNTVGKRLGAAAVDAIIVMPLSLLESFLSGRIYNELLSVVLASIFTFCPIVYSVILHGWSGQTVGKWVAGIKVVDVSENRLMTFTQAAFRDSLNIVLATIVFIIFVRSIFWQGNAKGISDALDIFLNVSIITTGLELLSMLLNNKHRAIHDYLGKSVVIRVT